MGSNAIKSPGNVDEFHSAWRVITLPVVLTSYLWLPYGIGQTIIFLPCGFFFFLLFLARLISAVADWMSAILPHMVWP